eukprot:tig00021108_g18376.t1
MGWLAALMAAYAHDANSTKGMTGKDSLANRVLRAGNAIEVAAQTQAQTIAIERKGNENVPVADKAASFLLGALAAPGRIGDKAEKAAKAIADLPDEAKKLWHYAKIAAGVAAVLLAIWLAWQLRGAYQGARLQSAQLDYFLKAR